MYAKKAPSSAIIGAENTAGFRNPAPLHTSPRHRCAAVVCPGRLETTPGGSNSIHDFRVAVADSAVPSGSDDSETRT